MRTPKAHRFQAREDQLSIVFQGPLLGGNNGRSCGMTERALVSARKHFPSAEIILSTWESHKSDERLPRLTYDKIVFSNDPGAELRKDSPPTYNNVNRMIVSSINGLKSASRKFAIKTRSDMEFTSKNILSWFGAYEAYNSHFKILRSRVCVSQRTTINPRRLFPLPHHVCDWLCFGLREDLLDLFDVPLAPEPDNSRWFQTRPKPAGDFDPENLSRFMAEDYVWSSFLKKYRTISHDYYYHTSPEIIAESERYIANNLIVLSKHQLGIESLKYPGYAAQHLLKSYTWTEWLEMYHLYSGGPKVNATDFELIHRILAYHMYNMLSVAFPVIRPMVRSWRRLLNWCTI